MNPVSLQFVLEGSNPARYRQGNPQKKPTYFLRIKDGRYKLAYLDAALNDILDDILHVLAKSFG